VVHTAKNVEYCINGFRMKNSDETSILLLETMGTSKNKLMLEMFGREA